MTQLTKNGRFRDCAQCPEMVVVPAGEFMMGSRFWEKGRNGSEGPVHRVRIGRFAVGIYAVTFEEWAACVADGGCGGYRPEGDGWGGGRLPIIRVSWEDAQSYVRWLSSKTGEHYRLLSESEWEYAARAGTTTPFHTGRTISTKQANYGSSPGQPTSVGTYPPNAFGLYDMHGNVWEWVQDCWNGSYRGAPNDGSAWESGDCVRRVLRGGSWCNFEPRSLRSANRDRRAAGGRDGSLGFRVARTLTP